MIVRKTILFARADGKRKSTILAECEPESYTIAFRFKNKWHKNDMTEEEWIWLEKVLNDTFAQYRRSEPVATADKGVLPKQEVRKARHASDLRIPEVDPHAVHGADDGEPDRQGV